MAELIKSSALLSIVHIYDISSKANCSPGISITFSHVLKKFLNYEQLCLSSQYFENVAMFKKRKKDC